MTLTVIHIRNVFCLEGKFALVLKRQCPTIKSKLVKFETRTYSKITTVPPSVTVNQKNVEFTQQLPVSVNPQGIYVGKIYENAFECKKAFPSEHLRSSDTEKRNCMKQCYSLATVIERPCFDWGSWGICKTREANVSRI